MRACWLLAILPALAACRIDVPHFEADDVGADSTVADGAGIDGADVDAPSVDGPPGDGNGLTELIGRQWTVDIAGSGLRCVRTQVTTDTYITELRGIDPPGTHHSMLAISEAGATGDFNCTISDVGANYRILFTSENGGSQYTFPTGVGLRIAAGTYLTLAVHVENTTTSPITARTAVEVRTASAAQLAAVAEPFVAGDISFTIPSNVTNYSTTGGCTLTAATNLLAFAPHMHGLGRRQLITLFRGGAPQIAYDGDYDVHEQRSLTLGVPLSMAVNDQISVRCTYDNPINQNVPFGLAYEDEVCFATFLRYPATGGPTVACAN